MSSDDIVIDVVGVGKRYEIYAAPRDRLKQMLIPRLHDWLGRHVSGRSSRPQFYLDFWALQDVSFQVRRGETVGIIGRNGSGKSTLLQMVAGTLTPSTGHVITRGRVAALLELGSGFNPEYTGRENVYLNCAVLGMTRDDVDARMEDIIAFADIGDFVDQPVKTYSSGMFLRLAFAVQAHIDASLVLIDEALAVGDVFFRQKCYLRLEQLKASGAAILFVSHSMPDVEQLCDRAVLLDHGRVACAGAASEASKHYYLMHQAKGGGPRVSQEAGSPQHEVPFEVDDRLPMEGLIDLSTVPQVGTGAARCSLVALCDTEGRARRSFRQGDTAVFHYVFELSRSIGAPIGGIVISNERGVIVHGKNGWQFPDDVPRNPAVGARLHYRHEVKLDLAPGDYVFEVGLAAVDSTTWDNRFAISHEMMNGAHERVCHLPRVGAFSIGLAQRSNGVPYLTHHGVADLPGRMQLSLVDEFGGR